MVALYQGASLPNPSLFFPSFISSLSFFLPLFSLLPLSFPASLPLSGALGTVVGFGFQENEDPHEYAHHKENACKDRAAMDKAATTLHKEYRPPLVYVQLDSAAETGGDFEGIKGVRDEAQKDERDKDLKGVVCF